MCLLIFHNKSTVNTTVTLVFWSWSCLKSKQRNSSEEIRNTVLPVTQAGLRQTPVTTCWPSEAFWMTRNMSSNLKLTSVMVSNWIVLNVIIHLFLQLEWICGEMFINSKNPESLKCSKCRSFTRCFSETLLWFSQSGEKARHRWNNNTTLSDFSPCFQI